MYSSQYKTPPNIVIDIILVLLEDEPICIRNQPSLPKGILSGEWLCSLTSSDNNPTYFTKNNVCGRSQEKSLRRVSKQPGEQQF